jgi:hypothetical protein
LPDTWGTVTLGVSDPRDDLEQEHKRKEGEERGDNAQMPTGV